MYTCQAGVNEHSYCKSMPLVLIIVITWLYLSLWMRHITTILIKFIWKRTLLIYIKCWDCEIQDIFPKWLLLGREIVQIIILLLLLDLLLFLYKTRKLIIFRLLLWTHMHILLRTHHPDLHNADASTQRLQIAVDTTSGELQIIWCTYNISTTLTTMLI